MNYLAQVTQELGIRVTFATFGEIDSPVLVKFDTKASETQILYSPRAGLRFLISHGREILIDHQDSVSREIAELLCLEYAVPMLLSQRGALTFHSACVLAGDGCVLVMGENGVGKSTLAAECLIRGLDVFADDCAVFALNGSEQSIFCTSPYIRLTDDSVKLLNLTQASIVRSAHGKAVLRHRADPGEQRRIDKVTSIFLERGENLSIKLLESIDCFSELLKADRFRELHRVTQPELHLSRMTSFAQRISGYKIIAPKNTSIVELLSECLRGWGSERSEVG